MRICRIDKVKPGLKTIKDCNSREAASPVSAALSSGSRQEVVTDATSFSPMECEENESGIDLNV